MKNTFEILVDDYVYSCDRNVWLALPRVLGIDEKMVSLSMMIVNKDDLHAVRSGVMRPLDFCDVFEQKLREVVDYYGY